MKYLKINFFVPVLALALFTFTSCNDDEGVVSPITNGASVNIENTLQADATTNGVETPIETLFSLDEGSLAATATVSSGLEFPAYLLGLYDIDLDESSISFELVAAANDPTYSSFFRTLEAGTTDRYYLTFPEGHNVSGFTSDNSSVNLRIDSDTVIVVEVGEGFNFNPGSAFTIALE